MKNINNKQTKKLLLLLAILGTSFYNCSKDENLDKPGTYVFTSSNGNIPNTFISSGRVYVKDPFGVEYSWEGYPSSANILYSSYENSYTKLTISKMYKRTLDNGVHKYADGNFEATFLGGQKTSFAGQLKLTGNFEGFECFF